MEVDGETARKVVEPDKEPLAVDDGAEQLDHSIDDTDHVEATHGQESNALAEGRRLYVGNLDHAATADDLEKLFKEFRVYVLVEDPSEQSLISSFAFSLDMSNAHRFATGRT